MDIRQYENYQEKKQHGEISFPFDTYPCTIPLDFNSVPLHWHEEMEIIFVKKGMGAVDVNLQQIRVSAGSIVIVLPGQLHTIYAVNETERMEYENIIFNPGILLSRQADTCTKDYLLPLFSGKISIPIHFYPGVPHYEEIYTILDNCDRIGESKPFGDALYIKSQLFMLLFVLENRCRLSEMSVTNETTLNRMKPVIKYVEMHYAEKISVEQAAEIAACSSSYFMRLFRETFHMSFVEYLKDYRLTIAARMLTQSQGNVLEIAEDSGFDSLSYFTRCFKAKYGMTPGRYASMNR